MTERKTFYTGLRLISVIVKNACQNIMLKILNVLISYLVSTYPSEGN